MAKSVYEAWKVNRALLDKDEAARKLVNWASVKDAKRKQDGTQ